MDNILDMVKDKINDLVGQIKADDGLLTKFKADPIGTVKELLGKIDLPDGALDNIVDGIKDKLAGKDDGKDDGKDEGGLLGGLLDKAKDLLG